MHPQFNKVFSKNSAKENKFKCNISVFCITSQIMNEAFLVVMIFCSSLASHRLENNNFSNCGKGFLPENFKFLKTY